MCVRAPSMQNSPVLTLHQLTSPLLPSLDILMFELPEKRKSPSPAGEGVGKGQGKAEPDLERVHLCLNQVRNGKGGKTPSP